MNIVLSESNFKPDNLYYMEPVINTIIDNSMFIKIVYSNNIIVMNGIYLNLNLIVNRSEVYFKKIKYSFDINNTYNNNLLNKVYRIESAILTKYLGNKIKSKRFVIYDTLKNGIIKLFPNSSINLTDYKGINNNTDSVYVLKISGIWENTSEIGLTYKLTAC
jgi:hypothetical protein